jgi:hypothetical protein
MDARNPDKLNRRHATAYILYPEIANSWSAAACCRLRITLYL